MTNGQLAGWAIVGFITTLFLVALVIRVLGSEWLTALRKLWPEQSTLSASTRCPVVYEFENLRIRCYGGVGHEDQHWAWGFDPIHWSEQDHVHAVEAKGVSALISASELHPGAVEIPRFGEADWRAENKVLFEHLALARRVGRTILWYFHEANVGPEELEEIVLALERGDFEYLSRNKNLLPESLPGMEG